MLGDASKKAAFDRMGSLLCFCCCRRLLRSSLLRRRQPLLGRVPALLFFFFFDLARTQQRPPSLLSNLFRLVVARSTRGDAWAHVALAAAAMGGAALAATAGDDLWRAANKGKLFEDVVAARGPAAAKAAREERRARGRFCFRFSSLAGARSAAASSGRSVGVTLSLF